MDKLTIKDLPGPSIFPPSPRLVSSLPFLRPARTKAKVVPRAAGDVFDVGAPSLGGGPHHRPDPLIIWYIGERGSRRGHGCEKGAKQHANCWRIYRKIRRTGPSHIGVQFQVFTAGSRPAKFTGRPIIIIRGDSAVRGVHQGSRDILPFRLFLHPWGGGGGGGGGMRGRERRIGPLPSRDIGPAFAAAGSKNGGSSIASPFTAPISLHPALISQI